MMAGSWIFLAAVGSLLASIASAATLLPYGSEHGDIRSTQETTSVSLSESFTFLDDSFSTIRVNSNGILHLGPDANQDTKYIAPFYGDADISRGGSVFYRTTNNSTLVQQVSNIVTASFTGVTAPGISSLFITTWHQIVADGGLSSQNNTFQCVLAYGSSLSYVLFLYQDEGMEWTKGESAQTALVGLKNGESKGIILPVSRTHRVMEVTRDANTGTAGQWLFQVNDAQVQLPAPLVGLEAVSNVSESAGNLSVCVFRLSPGTTLPSLSLSLLVDGETGPTISFPAGSSRTCVEVTIVDDGLVEEDEEMIIKLTYTGSTSLSFLASTITISIIDDDVMVGWKTTAQSVSEDVGSVELCAVLQSSVQLSSSVTASLMRFERGVNSDDYTLSSTELTFDVATPSTECIDVTIRDDSTLENDEILSLILRVEDPRVSVTPSLTSITILDNGDSIYVEFKNKSIDYREDDVRRYDRSLDIFVQVSGTTERPFNVSLRLVENTAKAGVHYRDVSGVYTVPGGESTYIITVPVIDDNIYNVGGRRLIAVLSSSDPMVRIDPAPLPIHIEEDDASDIQINFSQDTFSVSEGDKNMEVCIRMISGKLGPDSYLDVNFTSRTIGVVAGREAMVGEDFLMAERTVRFNSSHTILQDTECLNIPLINDDVLEDQETFIMEINKIDKSQEYVLQPFTVACYINDNDYVHASLEETELTVREVRGSGSRASICVTIQERRAINVVLVATPVANTATARDFFNTPQSLVFTPNINRQCTTIAIRNDFELEGPETFFVDISARDDNSHVVFNQSRAVITIEDTDLLRYRILAASDVSNVMESESCGYNNTGRFCIHVTGAVADDVAFSIYTVDGTATVGEDYAPVNETLILPAELSGAWTGCIRYCTMDDNIVEGDESYYIVVDPSLEQVLPIQSSSDRLTVTIHDDDVLRVVPTRPTITVNEGVGVVEICADMTGLSERPVELVLNPQNMTAKHGEDFTILDQTIYFPSYLSVYGHLTAEQVTEFAANPPITRHCANISIIDDSVLESIKSKVFKIFFTSSSLDQSRLHIDNNVTVTIEDDDDVTMSLSAAMTEVIEGTPRVRLQLVLVGSADFPISATIATRSTTGSNVATAGVDYDVISGTTVVLPPHYATGDSLDVELSVRITDDTVLEANETFEVVLSTGTAGVAIGTPRVQTVSIIDNDYAEVNLEKTEFRVLEGDLHSKVCAILNGATETSIIINTESNPGTAETTDYVATPMPAQLVFPPSSESQQTSCVYYEVVDDDILEAVESFFVTLSTTAPRVSIEDRVALVNIVDNDGVYMSLINSHVVEEGTAAGDDGAQVEMCVRMTGIIQRDVSIYLSTLDATAQGDLDYIVANHSVVFSPMNDLNQTKCVMFTYLDDDTVEENEHYFVQLTSPGNTTGNISILINRARITILDDDQTTINFEHSSYSVTEGEDSEVEVCVDIGDRIEKEIVVQFSTIADSAQHYHDFLENGSQLIFPARGSTRVCTPIVIMNDAVLEDEEQFEVFILWTDPALGHPTHTNATAVVRIGDDDLVTLWLENPVYQVSEEVGSLSVCTILNGTTSKEIPITFSSRSGTARDVSLDPERGDFRVPQTVLTFPVSSEHQQTLCVDITVLDDRRVEDLETFYLDISTNVPRIRLSHSTSAVRIQDNDIVNVAVTDEVLSAEEGDEVVLCVERNGILEKTVSIDITLVPGTAQATRDYIHEDVRIQFSQSYVPQRNECSVFRIKQDNIVELTEVFFARLSSSDPSVTISQNETRIEIYDSDNTTVDFQTLSYSVEEHDSRLSICVTLQTPIEKNASVGLVTGGVTALDGIDYSHMEVELTFVSGGSTTLCSDIAITDDNVVEKTEEFMVFLMSRDNTSLVLPGGVQMRVATVTITDNDNVTVSLEGSEIQVVEEDGEVDVCVRLTGVIDKDVSVLLTTVQGTAVAGGDYITDTKEIFFRPSSVVQTTNCTTFTLVNDQLVEATESFFVQLATTGDRQVIPRLARTEVIVEDSDTVYVDFTQLSQTVSEAAGSVSICVELESRAEIPLSLQLATRIDTAHQPQDFNNTYVILEYEPRGELNQCTTISINDDNILEDEEQFLVYIFDSERIKVRENDGGRGFVDVLIPGVGSGGEAELRTLSGGVRSVVVIEDNDRVIVGMEKTAFTVLENETNVEVCLRMDGETERRINVLMKTVDGTAKVGNDFFALSRPVTFNPRSGIKRVCVVVEIIDRPAAEGDEKFYVQLSSSMSTSIVDVTPREATILILDDDVACEQDRTSSARGTYVWKKSRPGVVVELSCEFNDRQNATRTCTRDGNMGKWETPNLDHCRGDIIKIFEELEHLPFSCLNFHELLLAVMQATEEKAFEVKYISIVARFFSEFATITSREDYNNLTCRGGELDAFTVGVNITNLLFQWPREIVWTNSTSILLNFEAVSENMVSRPESAEKEVLFSNIAFSSSRDEMVDLEKDGVMREFYGTDRGPLSVSEEENKAESSEEMYGSIKLPPSLFATLSDKEANRVGVWFSLHRTAHLFPLDDIFSENSSVSTPVISATVGGHEILNLLDPVHFSIRLINPSVTDTKCASWDYEEEEWVTTGCTTESVKDGYITCTCTHLTNFAGIGGSLLPSVSPLRQKPTLAMSILALIGVMLGLLGLILTIFILLAFGKLRRRRTTILRAQLCFSLLFLMLAYIGHIIVDHTGSLPQDIVPPCAMISTFTHYFTLTSLIWLGSEALLLFRKIVLGERLGDLSNIYFVTVSTTSWLVPIPFATIPAVLNRDWIITDDQYCFISSLPVFLVTFAIPALTALLFNLIIYLIVICIYIRFKCKKQPPLTEATTAKKRKMKKSRREATVRLIFSSPITGVLFVLAWMFASLTMITGEASIALYFFSGVFTAALGWFLFIYYIVTAKDTRKLVHEAFCGKPKKNLNMNQFISMESLGQASGIDESDSDSDYPERERRYGEFDVTYVGRKAALIEQKFSIRWGEGEGGEGEEGRRGSGSARGEGRRRSSGGEGTQSVGGQILFSAFTPSSTTSTSDKPEAPVAAIEEGVGSPKALETVLEDEEVKSGGDVSPIDENTLQIGLHEGGSQEDVNSDDGSPRESTATKNFLVPAGQIVFTMSPSS